MSPALSRKGGVNPAVCVMALVLACGAAAAAEVAEPDGPAEPTGAIGSRSAHEPGSPEEALEHEHGPRHGGFFGDADDIYHYEVLLEPGNQLVLYVNDEHNEPLDVRVLEGRWILNPDTPTPMSGTFAPAAGGSRFLATLPPLETDPVHITIAVPKEGVWAEMEFFLPVPQPAD